MVLDPISTLTHKNPYTFRFSEFRRKKLRPKSLIPPISASLYKDIWTRDEAARSRHQRKHQRVSVEMEDLLKSVSKTTNEQELYAMLSPFKQRPLSFGFMVSFLSREPDWQRSLALLDWIHEEASYKPSVLAYNLVLRSVLRAKQWVVARGLFDEMRQRDLTPDRYTYSMLITHLGREGMFDSALALLLTMEEDRVAADLVLYTNLIHLCSRMCDYDKAISFFSRLKESGIRPDLSVYNTMINVFGKAKLYCQAALLLREMKENGVTPDRVSYSTLLSAFVANRKLVEAMSVFADMNDAECELDLATCNTMIHVFGQLGKIKEADGLFWSMRSRGVEPNLATYNTMLRAYGDAELFGEAIHLFQLMQKQGIEQNVATYNNMIKMYGSRRTCDHEEAENLVEMMQMKGIEPNSITLSTIVSMWAKAGKLDDVALLIQKLISSGVEIDELLYQTMVVAYTKAGLVEHAKRLLRELKRGADNNIPMEIDVRVLARAGQIEEATWAFQRALNTGEVRDISMSMFRCMLELYSKNKMHINVIEVFEKMLHAPGGLVPDSSTLALVLDSYGDLRQFEKADAIYREMQERGCDFSNEVHFQMLSLYGLKGDFNAVASLFENLDSNLNMMNKKELRLLVSSIYERANRTNEKSSRAS
ncbi:hypothetical protein Dimus_000315 [Dionaea muscipula]